jgi:hydrogenase expression/formation protein HypC
MCLAVPGQIIAVTDDDLLTRSGRVQFGGIIKDVNLAFVPEASVGDWVIVHVGFALNTIDEQEAAQTLADLRALGELDDAIGSTG